jgi:hypothetical protein
VGDDLGRTVDTFDEAFDLIRENAEWLLGVVVEWKFGGKTGLDVVLYSAPAGTNDTITFAEQRIDFLIDRKIALAMHHEHRREAARKMEGRTTRERYDSRPASNPRMQPN